MKPVSLLNRKLDQLIWVFKTFKNPLTFVYYLYNAGSGKCLLKFRNGLMLEARKNRWDISIILEIFYSKPYIGSFHLPSNPTIVDIGCYIGDFSIFMAHYYSAHVYAFEPDPSNYSVAQRNVSRNVYPGSINLFNSAVGDGEPLILNVFHSHDEVHVSSESFPGSSPVSVPSLGLAEALSKAGTRVNLLKVDCEGFEYNIFDSATSSDLSSVDNIVLEYHCVQDWKLKLVQLKRKITSAGFIVDDQYPYLFCKRSRPPAFAIAST